MIWLEVSIIVLLGFLLYFTECDLAPGPRWWTRPMDAIMRWFT